MVVISECSDGVLSPIGISIYSKAIWLLCTTWERRRSGLSEWEELWILVSFPFLVRTLSPKTLHSKWNFNIDLKNNSSLTAEDKIIEFINKITTTYLNLILILS